MYDFHKFLPFPTLLHLQNSSPTFASTEPYKPICNWETRNHLTHIAWANTVSIFTANVTRISYCRLQFATFNVSASNFHVDDALARIVWTIVIPNHSHIEQCCSRDKKSTNTSKNANKRTPPTNSVYVWSGGCFVFKLWFVSFANLNVCVGIWVANVCQRHHNLSFDRSRFWQYKIIQKDWTRAVENESNSIFTEIVESGFLSCRLPMNCHAQILPDGFNARWK